MKFNDYVYTRPDMDEIKKVFDNASIEFTNTQNVDEQINIINKVNTVKNTFSTMETLCSIRSSVNTLDEFYEKERDFFDETSPIYISYTQDFDKLVYNSVFQNELRSTFGDHYFNLIEVSLKSFSKEIIEDLQLENKLTSSYGKLKASAQIPFDGKILTLPQLAPYMESSDRTIRKMANDASCSFYKEHEEEFDEIYDQMVKVRTTIAHKLGFKNYVELGYLRLGRTDYNEEMVKSYREQVYEDVVPLVVKLRNKQAKRIGLTSLFSYDENINFLEGNPKPTGSTSEKVQKASIMYHEMSKETGTYFDFMTSHDLFDLDSKKGKEGGGYCTFIPDYHSPFIFANFNGTSADVDVLTHEAGHAFQVYSSQNAILPEYLWPTYEACEIHSMSMEFFAWNWMKLFFGTEEAKYRFLHLSSTITFIPYGVTVDEFQHEIYNHPEMTKEMRKETWHKIEQKYMPYRHYDNELLEKGAWWYRQGHIFEAPFYYIDYTLAQVCAHQFFLKNQQNHELAWVDYYNLCKVGGSKSFLNLLPIANLKNPFTKGTLKPIMKELEKWLDDNAI